MTQDEIIEMAMKSGCPKENALDNMDILQDFAKLVAKHTLMNIDPSKFMSYHERKEVGDVNPM